MNKEGKAALRKSTHSSEFQVKCLNTKISWEQALVNSESGTIKIDNFTVNELISCASTLQSGFCLPVNQLPGLRRDVLINVLLQFFSIMLVTKENVSVLLDFEELSLNKDAFNLLLDGGDASSKEIALADDDDDSAEKDDLEQAYRAYRPAEATRQNASVHQVSFAN